MLFRSLHLPIAQLSLEPELVIAGSLLLANPMAPELEILPPGLSIQATDSRTGGVAGIEVVRGHCNLSTSACTASLMLRGELSSWESGMFSADGISLDVAAGLGVEGDAVTVHLHEGHVAAASLQVTDVLLTSPGLSLAERARMDYHLVNGLEDVLLPRATLELPRVVSGAMAASSVVNLADGYWRPGAGGFSLDTRYLNLQSPLAWLPALSFSEIGRAHV